MEFKVYDKAVWQIDGGLDKKLVLERFKSFMVWCHKKKLLSLEGEEIFDLGIDSSCSLHERMFTPKGNLFMKQCYDHIENFDEPSLEKAYENFSAKL